MKGVFENNDLSIVAKEVECFRPFPPMFHAHLEVVYVIQGSVRMQIDGIARTLMPGELSLCFPYVIHSYQASPEARAVILLFSAASAGPFSHRLLQAKPELPYLAHCEDLLPLLRQIVRHRATDTVLNEMVAGAYLSALVGELLLRTPMIPVDEMDTAVIRKLLTYCAKCYREEISVRSAAEALHISQSYVTKIFSAKLGCSFRTYINSLRIGEVKKLLANTDRTILDIMYDCGFNNQSSFNRVFIQETGMTPSAYRQQLRQK